MNRTAPSGPVTTTVSGLSDRRLMQQLKQLTAVEHQLEVVVIDHLRELERRRLYLSQGFSSLFDYATRELGYSEAAAWRRIKAMRLCGEVEGARERMRDGSLTLNSAALLQHAFDRQERKRTQSAGGRRSRDVRPPAAPNGSAPSASAPPPDPGAPVLDSSARQALVKQAAGKSTRQVENLLAAMDPELAAPADRMRPLGAGRWEIKAVIDDECRRGLEQLKGLLSHVDPHMTLGQLVGRVVREAVERHDPARPPRGRRTVRAAAGGAAETSAPKEPTRPGSVAAPARLAAIRARVTPSPAKASADFGHRVVAAKRPGVATRSSAPKNACGTAAEAAAHRTGAPRGVKTSAAKVRKRPRATTQPSAPKEPVGPDSAAAPARLAAIRAGVTTSPAKAPADSMRGQAAPARRPAGGAARTSAPKAGCAARPQAGPAAAAQSRTRVRGRSIPAAVKRQVWERDRSCCSYVDPRNGRRCGSRYLIQIDHVVPYALGGSAALDNLRLLCAAHHRHRHADRATAGP